MDDRIGVREAAEIVGEQVGAFGGREEAGEGGMGVRKNLAEAMEEPVDLLAAA
jgi:hypothetical protein